MLDTQSAVVIMALLHVRDFALCRASLLPLTGEALVSELYEAKCMQECYGNFD